jgi:hypothetical protein
MAEISTIARPYAVAAYKLGREQNALSKWSEMLGFAAAAKPSAISFWRASIAFNSGGQTNFTVNQINTANAIACAISVKLMFIFDPFC